jgi:hypothetical protein
MEASKGLNYPYLITRDTSPSRANLEVFRFSSSEGCPATATCLASTQALRYRRVSSASKHLGASDQSGQTAPLGRLDRPGGQTAPLGRLDRPGWPHLLVESSASVLWLNRVTLWFSGEPLQAPRTPCSLRQSPLMTRLPHSPGWALVLRLNQETDHDFVPLFLPPCGPHLTPLAAGSSNQAYLSSPHLEASPATTFHACSSPAPTPVKPQPAPAILSQESVHTMLSITHHTRKRSSTGPRTTHGPQSPP